MWTTSCHLNDFKTLNTFCKYIWQYWHTFRYTDLKNIDGKKQLYLPSHPSCSLLSSLAWLTFHLEFLTFSFFLLTFIPGPNTWHHQIPKHIFIILELNNLSFFPHYEILVIKMSSNYYMSSSWECSKIKKNTREQLGLT